MEDDAPRRNLFGTLTSSQTPTDSSPSHAITQSQEIESPVRDIDFNGEHEEEDPFSHHHAVSSFASQTPLRDTSQDCACDLSTHPSTF